MDENVKNELNNEIEEKSIQSILKEKLFIDFDISTYLNCITKTCIQFLSTMYSCIRNLDQNYDKLDEKLKYSYFAFLTQLEETCKQSNNTFTLLNDISTTNCERINELKNSDFSQKNDHFINAALQSTLNYQNAIKEGLAYQADGNLLFFLFLIPHEKYYQSYLVLLKFNFYKTHNELQAYEIFDNTSKYLLLIIYF